jgi:hypothetical protein
MDLPLYRPCIEKLNAITATAAEINTLASSGVTNADLIKLHAITATAATLNSVPSYFDVTLTTTQVNAGTSFVVPAVTGKQFYPVFAAMSCTGTPSVASVLSLIQDPSGVVLSHVVADLATTLWAGPTGGTVVTTLLNTALTVSKGILATSTGTLTTTTAVRYIVCGYYL